MNSRSTLRTLLAAVIVAAVTLVPTTAWAACTFNAQPNPAWRGATVTFQGFGMQANTAYYVNLNGLQIKNGTTNQNGAFSFDYVIPGDYATGTGNWFVGQNPGCEMTQDRPFTVLASEPTTTTTTTTLPPTTTTVAETTTTVAETTTTVAATTTTAAGVTTTTAAGDTTTTVPATTTTTEATSDDDGGGSSIIMYILIAAALGGLLVFLGMAMGRRRR